MGKPEPRAAIARQILDEMLRNVSVHQEFPPSVVKALASLGLRQFASPSIVAAALREGEDSTSETA
jgi:hypothetical protein